MNCHNSYLKWTFFLIFLTTCRFSIAKQTNLTSDIPKLDQFLNAIYEWRANQQQKQADTGLKLLEAPTVVAGVLCFLAASISSAGGVGGGGLYVPILTIIAGVDLKTASSFSAFMVTGGSIANVVCNMFIKNSGKILIDFDIALLSQPCMLLGVSIGVICNRVLPEWLITILFAVFLGFCTFKTCKSGFCFWKLESEVEVMRRNGNQELENGLLKNESFGGAEPLLEKEEKGLGSSSIPWMKMGVLVMFWFSFFFLYLLRGNRYGQGIIPMEVCGVGYWIISSVQFPLAVIFTSWILYNRETQHNIPSKKQEGSSETKHGPSGKLIFPLMALLAGVLGGVFGIGGGMLISPLLIQVGITPEVTAATCSFMVFFSSSMSAVQYLLLGMEQVDNALIFALVCCVASIVGLVVVQRAIEHHGRASLIVFSVGIVMALSTVLMTSFGAVDIWRDYTSGNYMGFKLPC
ncbi:sulfite exporter TauE/SafE family protein 5 [Nicotiana tomentosiformis]|uniref:sulfite exporter TauE/SafE family protein 5 n=1 Tax=Nicotiana tomentosiformis TaxID=4098 RepID=UPI00051BBEAD|nr:sulfite exporter TauE/SafE family protein 5 isoform X1 [Nicotiana tomentosiformis]